MRARRAAILNALYMVRHYRRPCLHAQRDAAIKAAGAIVREAFNATDDFEPIFAAILDGLRPEDERPF